MRKIESDYLDLVAKLPCALCGAMPVEVHHPREWCGMAQRASHFLAVPLCPDCHRGSMGIHGSRALLAARKLEEVDLLASTIEKVFRRLR